MKKALLAALALTALVAAPSVRADPIDMSTVTCEALGTMDEDGATFMLIWIDGYVAGTNEELSMDPNILGAAVQKIAEYCKANPEMSVLNAAKETAAE